MSPNVTRVIVDTIAHWDTEDVAIVPELAESLAQLLNRSAPPLPDRTAMTYAPDLRSNMRFGEFEFAPGLRRLERRGAVVELSSRAIDILAVLTERPGEVIPKRELLARVWPDVVVGEAALRVHMVALRRALGDGEGGNRFIVTVPGRGYCFVGSLELAVAGIEGGTPLPSDGRRALPAAPAKAVGRDEVVEDLLARLELQQFVTVVGPDGVGKTTVVLMVAHQR